MSAGCRHGFYFRPEHLKPSPLEEASRAAGMRPPPAPAPAFHSAAVRDRPGPDRHFFFKIARQPVAWDMNGR